MQLPLLGDEDVLVKRFEDWGVWNTATFAVPSFKYRSRARKRILNDLVFDRSEKHVGDRGDEGYQNEDQKGRDQKQSAHLLASQRASEATLERCAIGRQHCA